MIYRVRSLYAILMFAAGFRTARQVMAIYRGDDEPAIIDALCRLDLRLGRRMSYYETKGTK